MKRVFVAENMAPKSRQHKLKLKLKIEDETEEHVPECVPLPNNWLRLPFSQSRVAAKREGKRGEKKAKRKKRGILAERAGIGESALECRNRIRVPSTTELNRWQTERQTGRGRKRQQDGEKERERHRC